MAKTKKILGIAALGFVLLVAIGLVVATMDHDSPALGRALLDQAAAAGGIELEAEGFHLNLLKGLQLENVVVRSPMEGGSLSATAEKLVLRHRLGAVLRGEILVEDIVLVRPNLELVSSDSSGPATPATGGATAAAPPGAGETPVPGAESGAESGDGTAGSGLTLRIQRFVIEDGKLVTRVEGVDEPPTEVRGLDLELRNLATEANAASLIQGLTGEGELSARELLAGETRATDVAGTLRLAGGHLLLADCGFATDFGDLVLTIFDLDLNHDPYRFEMALAGDALRTHPFLGGADGGGCGSGRLAVKLKGDLSETLDLDGQGGLAVNTGELPATEILDALQSLLRIELVGQQYNPFEVGFVIGQEQVVAEPFRIVVGDVELAIGGGAGLFDETLKLQLGAIGPRARFEIDEIPKEVIEALTDVDGRVNLPIRIGGTMTQPKVVFDRSAWGQLARRRLENEAQKEIAKGLSRLFGKKED